MGRLMGIACNDCRKPKLKPGICGEYGGESSLIAICEQVGRDDVSRSPFRVPVAWLAAQAVLSFGRAGSSGFPLD